MALLDKRQQKWYCYKDDEVYFAGSNKWQGDEQPTVRFKVSRRSEPLVGNEVKVIIVIAIALGAILIGSQMMCTSKCFGTNGQIVCYWQASGVCGAMYGPIHALYELYFQPSLSSFLAIMMTMLIVVIVIALLRRVRRAGRSK